MAASGVATCSVELWTYNSLNQSPCVVGSALGSVCHASGQFSIPPLPPRAHYVGPWARPTEATPCRCSTVFYSLLSACAYCQASDFIGWSDYSANCTTVYSGVFPRAIPRGIAVPAWAYMDVNATDFFNPLLAEAYGGTESGSVPSSTASPPPPTTISPPSIPTTVTVTASTPSAPAEAATTTRAASLDGLSGKNSASQAGFKAYGPVIVLIVAVWLST
ncbi:hypothetical protein FA13DRAFT_1733820 [Coprinellus micaceus]|uniref:Uncharacterized protein n=1 Tax=Coprinellus micaceus TaxID=71717 RepID=A0A4Y7T8M1_COPMI|nr:hypothetical protein FA13DRAFT_1733820 [Coprinellus micaceus]